MGAPPTERGAGGHSRSTFAWSCEASSRLGETKRAERDRSGSTKASVLPAPVWARRSALEPLAMESYAASWMGVGDSRPAEIRREHSTGPVEHEPHMTPGEPPARGATVPASFEGESAPAAGAAAAGEASSATWHSASIASAAASSFVPASPGNVMLGSMETV
eukprot:scaffold26962_cov114-Isochrysis_galbana.AAC.16